MEIRSMVVLVAVLTGGCTFLPQPDAADTTLLQLSGNGAVVAPATPTALTLLVAEPRAVQPYATPRFAYMVQDRELRYFARHEWAAEPAHMMQPALVRALEASGRFAAVVASPTPATADMRVDLDILDMHQDFRGDGPSEFLWRIRAQVTALEGRRVIGTRVFEAREPAGGDATAGAAAADRALARLLTDLTAFVAELPFD